MKRASEETNSNETMIDDDDNNNNGGAAGRKRVRGNIGVLTEGLRCCHVDDMGWRCCNQTIAGLTLCERHLWSITHDTWMSEPPPLVPAPEEQEEDPLSLSSPSLFSYPSSCDPPGGEIYYHDPTWWIDPTSFSEPPLQEQEHTNPEENKCPYMYAGCSSEHETTAAPNYTSNDKMYLKTAMRNSMLKMGAENAEFAAKNFIIKGMPRGLRGRRRRESQSRPSKLSTMSTDADED